MYCPGRKIWYLFCGEWEVLKIGLACPRQYFWKINLSFDWTDTVICQAAVGPTPKAALTTMSMSLVNFCNMGKEMQYIVALN